MLSVGVEERAEGRRRLSESDIHPQTDLVFTTGSTAEQREAEVQRDSLHAEKLTSSLNRKSTGLLCAPSVALLQSFNTFAAKQIAKRDYKTDPALKSDWMSHSSSHLEIVNILGLLAWAV